MDKRAAWVVALALVLRLTGVAFGWPGLVHPDEALYMPTAIRMLADRSLLPGDLFHNPHFLTYIDMALAACVIGFWRVAGMAHDASTLGTLVWSNVNTLVVAGRFVSVFCGTATVLSVFFLGRKLWNRRAGVVAAGLLAVSPLHVRDSHFGTNDILMTFLLVIGALAVVRLVEEGPGRWSIAAGALTGLAAGAKYNGGILVISLILGHVVVRRSARESAHFRRPVAWGLAALGIAGLGFLASNVGIILDVTTAVHGFLRQVRMASAPWPGQEHIPSILLNSRALVQALGLPAVVLSIAGLLLIRSSGAWVVMASALTYFTLMGLSRLSFARFMLPVLSFACLTAAVALDRVLEAIRSNVRSSVAVRLSGAALLAVTIVPPAVNAVRLDWLLLQGDTRLELTTWLGAHTRPGMIVLADSLTLAGLDRQRLPPGLTFVSFTPAQVWESTLSDVQHERPHLVILSGFAVLAQKRLLDQLRGAQWPMVHSISPFKYDDRQTQTDDVYAPWNDLWAWRTPGPRLWVFQARPSPDD